MKLFLLSLFVAMALAVNPSGRDGDNAALTQVTDFGQLWRYQVGPGFEGLTIGDSYITFLGNTKKFVRTTPTGWVISDGDNCKADHRYELRVLGGGVYGIKDVQNRKWWSCRDNGQLWGVDKLTSWERFKLYVDADGDNLIIRSSDWPEWYVYLWWDNYLYCSKHSTYYSGRNNFIGWKNGDNKWEATDGMFVIKTVDRTQESTDATVDVQWKQGYEAFSFVTKAGSMANSTAASESLRRFFTAQVKPSTIVDWKYVEESSFGPITVHFYDGNVPAGSKLRMTQLHGLYGPITIYTSYLDPEWSTEDGKGMLSQDAPVT